MFTKSLLLGMAFAATVVVGARAQTASTYAAPGQSIASLPPTDQGPRPSSHNHIPGSHTVGVAQSNAYPGPAPGASEGAMPQLYQKPTGYDENVGMHPYKEGMSPSPR